MNEAIIIIVATAVLIFFAAGYIGILLISNNKIIREQNRRIDEIQKSEQRYKALFDNSLAGIFKFDFARWELLDANQSALDMFNCRTLEEFQKSFLSIPAEVLEYIERSLINNGRIDECEIDFTLSNGIVRRFVFSAQREKSENIAHAIIIFVTAGKLIG